jgi:hypothetical protein
VQLVVEPLARLLHRLQLRDERRQVAAQGDRVRETPFLFFDGP